MDLYPQPTAGHRRSNVMQSLHVNHTAMHHLYVPLDHHKPIAWRSPKVKLRSIAHDIPTGSTCHLLVDEQLLMQRRTPFVSLHLREHLSCEHAIDLWLSLLKIFNSWGVGTLLAGLSLGGGGSIDVRVAEVVMAKCLLIREETRPLVSLRLHARTFFLMMLEVTAMCWSWFQVMPSNSGPSMPFASKWPTRYWRLPLVAATARTWATSGHLKQSTPSASSGPTA